MSGSIARTFMRIHVAVGLLLLSPYACTPGSPARSKDKLIASIQGQELYESDFARFYQFKTSHEPEAELPVLKSAIFNEFLVHRLLLHEANKENVEVEAAGLEAELARWLTDEAEDEQKEIRERVSEFLTVQMLIRAHIGQSVEVTPEEVREYYQEHEEEFGVADRIRLREILVSTREKAEEIRSRLRRGRTEDFIREAAANSIGPTAETGGDLGYFEPGQLPEEFEKIAFSLLPGELSEVFESSHGFHLFLVEELVREHPQRLSEVSDLIFERLVAEKERAAFEQYLNRLLQSASIEIYDKELQSAWRDYAYMD